MTISVSGHSHEPSRRRTDKDNGGEGLGGYVDNLLGRQLLVVAEATALQQPVGDQLQV